MTGVTATEDQQTETAKPAVLKQEEQDETTVKVVDTVATNDVVH